MIAFYVMLSESLSCLLSFSQLIVIINRCVSNSHPYDSKIMLLKIKLDLTENFSCLESCLSHGNHKIQENVECVQKMKKIDKRSVLYITSSIFFCFCFCFFQVLRQSSSGFYVLPCLGIELNACFKIFSKHNLPYCLFSEFQESCQRVWFSVVRFSEIIHIVYFSPHCN